MADFFVFFPSARDTARPEAFHEIEKATAKASNDLSIEYQEIAGAHLLTSSSHGKKPHVSIDAERRVLVVTKGVIFDTRNPRPRVDWQEFSAAVEQNDAQELLRYEGTFACAAWDGNSRRAMVFHDQASQLNVYYAQQPEGLYAASNALCLARGLGMGLNPTGVQDFLAMGSCYSPDTVFNGLHRLQFGEMLSYQGGQIDITRVWHPIDRNPKIRKRSEAVDALCDVITDRCRRYIEVSDETRLVCDITGGYDSRVIAASCSTLSSKFALTVNGPSEFVDVKIAKKVSEACSLELLNFDVAPNQWSTIDDQSRQTILYASNGELPPNEIARHFETRPRLAEDFDIHFNGSGGELLRYYPWSQEFFALPSNKPANLERALRYRYLPKKLPPFGIFSHDWHSAFENRLRHRIAGLFAEIPNAHSTEQLDTAFLWRRTVRPSAYLTSLHDLLPSVCPLLCAGVVEKAMSMDWKLRLTSRLQRQLIDQMNSQMAAVETSYGGLGSPISIKTFTSELKQVRNRFHKLFSAVDNAAFGGRLGGKAPVVESNHGRDLATLVSHVRDIVQSNTMLSAALYAPASLHAMAQDSSHEIYENPPLLERMMTVELLCRELDFEPDANFLNTP